MVLLELFTVFVKGPISPISPNLYIIFSISFSPAKILSTAPFFFRCKVTVCINNIKIKWIFNMSQLRLLPYSLRILDVYQSPKCSLEKKMKRAHGVINLRKRYHKPYISGKVVKCTLIFLYFYIYIGWCYWYTCCRPYSNSRWVIFYSAAILYLAVTLNA